MWTSHDGITREIYNLTHQHLSNILWFNLLIYDHQVTFGNLIEVLYEKYDGIVLPYRPAEQFESEIYFLKYKGYLNNGKIIYKCNIIGEVISSYS